MTRWFVGVKPDGNPHLDKVIRDRRFTVRQKRALLALLNDPHRDITAATLGNLRSYGLVSAANGG